jgi:hypothetical protein
VSERELPWYHETTEPRWVNEWTWTHVAWGLAAAVVLRDWRVALALHTVYEAVEGALFPREHRDVSLRNHLGDTAAFMAGFAVGRTGW